MTRAIVAGLGPIGLNCAKAVLANKQMKLVGLVDVDPGKLGQSVSELVGESPRGQAPRVVGSLDAALKEDAADVVIVCTSSQFEKVAPTLRECILRKLHVVTSCEEMAWPRLTSPRLADEIDLEARHAGVALLGTGVNPGFVMDFLPLVLSSQVLEVKSVRCVRMVDASTRRMPLQKKVGATMTVQQFNQLAGAGKIGHMGIGESVALIAAGLGRSVSKSDLKISLEPVVAENQLSSLLGTIQPGQVRGMRNTAHWSGDGLTIDLDLTMALGVEDPFDSVELDGPTPLKARIEGGTPGDTATVAVLVNFARLMARISPGLRTMLDTPVAPARASLQ
jgi:4-hydroxy-tetrahydrodipicolinate reductase